MFARMTSIFLVLILVLACDPAPDAPPLFSDAGSEADAQISPEAGDAFTQQLPCRTWLLPVCKIADYTEVIYPCAPKQIELGATLFYCDGQLPCYSCRHHDSPAKEANEKGCMLVRSGRSDIWCTRAPDPAKDQRYCNECRTR